MATEPAPLTPLTAALARVGLAEGWYRWCDRALDWSADAARTYEHDSLLIEHGGYAPLTIDEFMQAYRDAGATVSRGSRFPGPRHRSFTVAVQEGPVVASLSIRLGRGHNSEECLLAIVVDGEDQGEAEMLHVSARDIVLSRGESVPGPDAPYPRPIITSRSHLEISAREIVELLGRVVRSWKR